MKEREVERNREKKGEIGRKRKKIYPVNIFLPENISGMIGRKERDRERGKI